jgi:RNA polymerase sigma-70 factor (ECF subfamily)
MDRKHRRRKDTSPLELSVDYFADANSWDNSEEHNPAAQRLHRRIGKLHPFDRALILLWLEDLPYDEIAAILGITVKNVSVRLVRIREKLKTITD